MMEEWCSIEDVYAAYLDCRKHKYNSIQYSRFAANEITNIYDLWYDLNNFTYEIGYSEAFCVTRPKIREVFAAEFRDRIVHHLLMLRLMPLFERFFITDTFSCRKGKGTDYGVYRISEFVNSHPHGWILKCDIRSFFMNIDKKILANKLETFINENYIGSDIEPIQWLTRLIVMHRPETKCYKKGNLRHWDILPKDKSLFYTGSEKGLAIGNLTSQVFANFYLDELDKFVMSQPGLCYGRYVDDFVIVGDDKRQLLDLLPKIRRLLKQNLKLDLHPHKFYLQPVSHGVIFLGSVIKPNRIYTGNRTVNNVFRAVQSFILLENKERYIERLMSSYNSYTGFLVRRKTYNIRKRLWELVDQEIKKFCYIIGDFTVLHIKNIYKPKIKLLLEYSKRHDKKIFQKRYVCRDRTDIR